MSEQLIGSGANAFIIIVAVLAGFIVAMGYVDYNKTKGKECKRNPLGDSSKGSSLRK